MWKTDFQNALASLPLLSCSPHYTQARPRKRTYGYSTDFTVVPASPGPQSLLQIITVLLQNKILTATLKQHYLHTSTNGGPDITCDLQPVLQPKHFKPIAEYLKRHTITYTTISGIHHHQTQGKHFPNFLSLIRFAPCSSCYVDFLFSSSLDVSSIIFKFSHLMAELRFYFLRRWHMSPHLHHLDTIGGWQQFSGKLPSFIKSCFLWRLMP